jgi:hypothetical protein
MPRQCGHSKRGKGDYVLVGMPHTLVAGSGILQGNKKGSRSPSCGLTQLQDNGHTNSGWGYKIEWFEKRGRSLDYAPKSFTGWTSLKFHRQAPIMAMPNVLRQLHLQSLQKFNHMKRPLWTSDTLQKKRIPNEFSRPCPTLNNWYLSCATRFAMCNSTWSYWTTMSLWQWT